MSDPAPPAGPAQRRVRLDLDGPLLPASPDDDPVGWGDGVPNGDSGPSQRAAADYAAERPPHHDR